MAVDESYLSLPPLPSVTLVTVEEEFIIRAIRPGIFNRNGAMNSVKIALEDQSDALGHEGGAILIDGDRVLKVADAPRFCLRHAREADEQRKKNGNQRL